MNKSRLRFINIILTTIMVLNSIVTPQIAYALSDALIDSEAEEMVEIEEDETPDIDAKVIVEDSESVNENSDAAEVRNIDNTKATDTAEDEPTLDEDEEVADGTTKDINNTDPPVEDTYNENSNILPQSLDTPLTTLSEIKENLISNFSFTIIDKAGIQKNVENNERLELNLNELNALQLNYDLVRPEGITLNDGDTYAIDLPSIFKGSASDKPIKVDGITVAHYDIVNDQVIITFNENVEDFDEFKMNVNVSGLFNTEVFETEEEVVIEVPYSEGGSFTATLRREQQEYEGEDRKSAGTPYVLNEDGTKTETNRNPTHIDWTVRANDSAESINQATIIDDLDENLEIVEGSFVVERIIRNYNNVEIDSETVDVTPTITDSGFELNLGDIDDAYDISYTTRLIRPDGGGALSVNNNARIILDGAETLVSDNVEVSWSSDLPSITKTGHLTDDPHVIDWQVEYNYGKENLGIVTLTDTLTHGDVDLDSVEVLEVNVDIDGNIIGEGTTVNIVPVQTEDGMTLPDLDAHGKAYYITFSSTVPVGLKDTVINTISDNLDGPNSDNASVPVDTIPTGGKVGEQKVDDTGRPYIEWTITMNSEKINVGSINVIDIFDPTMLEFEVEKPKLYNLYLGNEVVDNFEIKEYPGDTDESREDGKTGFELTVQNAGPNEYKFVYRTYYTVKGMQEPNLANAAELIFRDGEGEGIGEPIRVDVDLKGPKAAISKSGNYVLNEGTGLQEIEWSVTFNKSKIMLNAGSTLTDTFTSDNYTLIEDSMALSTADGSTVDYTPTPNNDGTGFVITLNEATNSVITVKFKTTADDTNNLAHINKAVLEWEGGTEDATATVGKRDPGINKTGEVIRNADGTKSVNWTINFNTNKHVIYDFELVDTYSPASVTVSDIKVTSGDQEVTTDFEISDPENGKFTVKKDRLDAKSYQLTYTTTLSPEEEQQEIKNTANITYRGGEDKDDEVLPSPSLKVEKQANKIDREAENPAISWTIQANTDTTSHGVNLVDAVLEDTIPEDQKLISGTIEVKRVDDSDFQFDKKFIKEEDNQFSIDLPDGPYEYVVNFKTEITQMPSLDASVFDRYNNSAVLTNQTKNEDLQQVDSADANIRYYKDIENDLTGKTGEQNLETENIDYELTINPEGLTIHNATITDKLSNNHQYLEDSIKVMDANGVELKEGYTLSVAEDNRSFQVTFDGRTISAPHKISYETRLNADLIGTYNVTNNVVLTGGTKNTELHKTQTTTSSQQWFYGGGGSGRTIQFELNKLTSSGSSLEGVKFKLERVSFNGTTEPVDAEIVTNEKGVYISEKIRAGRFILTETETPSGYIAFDEPIYFSVGYAPKEAQDDYIITVMNSEWEKADHSNVTTSGNKLTVVNDYEPVTENFVASKKLTGQDLAEGQFSFELVDSNGDITTATNDADGNVEFAAQSFNSPGTYNFKIREVDNELGGVTYDTNEYDIQVVVTEGEKGLITEVKYLDGEANFENSYQAAPTEATIQAQKNLNGQDLEVNQFNFELVDSNGDVLTASNDADGNVTFETIEYNEAGEHTYTISEVDSGQGGVNYDTSTFEVTVSVTDDGEGQLHAEVTYPDDTTPVFTNNYAAEPGSIILEAQKVLEGRDLTEDDKFEFQLIGKDDDVNETVSSDVKGDIVFSEINYNTSGEYNYIIQEVAGELGGIDYDATVQKVTVTVIDNGEGQLVAEATYDNGEAVFTNTYTTTPTEATITGEKILEGQALAAEQFTFELYNNQDHRIDTTQNDAEGQFAFETIAYDTPGEYNYTVQEVQGSQGGVTYDTNEISVNVSVVDNGEGQLEATVNYIDGPVSFTNNYEAAPDSIVLEAEKILEGQILRDRQFAFELVNENDDVVQTESNNRNGQVIFNEISYDEVGTHHYTIREKTEELGGITQDPTVYSVTVEVIDNGQGQLIATANYNDGPAVFTNTYEAAPDSIVLEAQKHLEGQELVNNQFTFELIDESGEAIQETTNNANGQIIFDEITYEETGSHTYIIQEVKGVQGGMTYDDSRYVVVVTVEDDGQGKLVAEANYIGGLPVFINSYETTPDSAVIVASKVLEGQDLRNGQFEFELVDDSGAVLQTKENNAAGQVIFDEINYEEAGEYNYTIREVEGTQGGVTYDEAIYNVVVSVTDDREGTLTAEVQYVDGPVEFNNVYIPAPDNVVIEVSKILEGQNLRNGQFEFELVDGAGEVIETVSNNANGQVIFNELSFDTVGTYDYTIREVEGTQGGIDYDDSEISVTVEVTDDGEGQLHAVETYTEENVQFRNTYTTEPDSLVFEATKTLAGQDLRAGQFEFALLDYQGETLQTVTNNANGQIIFDERTYEAVGEYAYSIVEIVGTQGGITYDTEKFEILVTVTDDGEGQLIASADYIDGPVEFTNTYSALVAVVQLEAEKILEGKDLINNQFTFEVVDSEGVSVATGTNDVAGKINFEAIEFNETGTYEYIVRELVGEDVNINYDGSEFDVVIEVTDDGEGQLHAAVKYIDGTPVFENTFKKVSVGDYVWIDENKDGLQDETDIPLAGVVLVLKDEEGNIVTEDVYGNSIEPQVTDENGYYTFDNLPIDRRYTVEIDREASKEALKGLMPTLEEEGDDRADDSSTWSAESIFLNEDGQRDPTLDFGFVRKRVSVGDYVWIDENNDGLQDETDTPLEGVKLILKDEEGNLVTEDVDGNPIEPQITDENGYYSFDNLPADRTYTVEVDQEAFKKDFPELAPTKEHAGDSDVDSSTWTETSRLLTEDGERDPTLDFGFTRKRVSVGDYVWFDANKDGLQDNTDVPLEGVVLTITDEEGNPVTDVYGNPVGPTVTNRNGWYTFDNLPIDNTYIVRINREAFEDLYPEYVPTLTEVGDDRSTDSSEWIAISVLLDEDGQHDPTLDFGFILFEEEPVEELPKAPTGPEEPEDPTGDLPDTPGSEDSEKPVSKADEDLPPTGEAATYTLLAVALLTLGGVLLIFERKRENR